MSLFEIVDERDGIKGVQYNYIYGEGTKHGSVQVALMLDHFFAHTCPLIGNARVLHLHSDSLTGQNRYYFVLGYFKLRVTHGYHDEIIWHFN